MKPRDRWEINSFLTRFYNQSSFFSGVSIYQKFIRKMIYVIAMYERAGFINVAKRFCLFAKFPLSPMRERNSRKVSINLSNLSSTNGNSSFATYTVFTFAALYIYARTSIDRFNYSQKQKPFPIPCNTITHARCRVRLNVKSWYFNEPQEQRYFTRQ